MLHCVYGIFHLAHPAGARPPASSASYQVFSAFTDLAVIPLYTYGCLAVHSSSSQWGTLFQAKSLLNYFIPAIYYTLFGGAVVHLITLAVGLWLAVKFRQITRLPPDMNPLEDHLTSRRQKTSSMATTATFLSESEKRLSTPLEEHRRSGMPYEDIDRPPAVPFHATRSSPRSSFGSADLPPRQYQITPGNSPRGSPRNSPRNSATAADLKRMTAPPSSSHSNNPPAPPPRNPWRNSQSSFTDVSNDMAEFRPPYSRGPGQSPNSPSSPNSPNSPRGFGSPLASSPQGYGPTSGSPRGYGQQSRPGTGHSARQQPPMTGNPTSPSQERPAKFTEAWYATESLFNRTHERNRAMNPAPTKPGKSQGYQAVRHGYESDSDSDYENDDKHIGYRYRSVMSPPAEEIDDGDLGLPHHPEPLRSNPSLPSIIGGGRGPTSDVSEKHKSAPMVAQGRRPNTPFVRKSSALSEIDLNDQRVNGGGGNYNNNNNRGKAGGDITDEKPSPSYGALKASPSKRYTWAPTSAPRNRDSSIQPESEFYSKPYGELKSATPPLVVGSDRQVSSGNDYGGQMAKRNFSFGKRNVSGKVVEEGRGLGWAR